MFILLIFLVGLFSPSWGGERHWVKTTIHEDLQPTGELRNTRAILIDWTEMPLDHFDPQNTATFRMRYAYNDEFFGGDGYPVFILVGGYALGAGWLGTGNMFDMARENKGYMFTTEYRYYNESVPFTDFSVHNMRFLSMDQALADLAYFIGDLKKQPRFASSKIIMYGGSKAANMVTWFKKRYPHLVVGVIASSGPYLAKIDFTEYLEVVHEAFELEGDEQCMGIIRQGIGDTAKAISTESGRRTVEQVYRLCPGTFDFDNRLDLGYFSGMITWSFSGEVQYAAPGYLRSVCENFKSNVYGTTPMEQIAGYVARVQNQGDNCWILKYDNFVNGYRTRHDSRAWYYQTCTEFGYFQVTPHSGTVFDPLVWLDVAFYVGICERAFDPKFDEAFAYSAATRSNLVFGGLSPDVNNTINIHGYIDPWRAIGIYKEDIQETSPTYTVPRASHCFDMRAWARTDTIQMTAVQQRARRIVKSWLNN